MLHSRTPTEDDMLNDAAATAMFGGAQPTGAAMDGQQQHNEQEQQQTTTLAAAMSPPPPRQRIRGESFKQEYQGGLRRRARRRRDPSMCKTDNHFVIPAQDAKYEGKLVLVLDLDETLVFARYGPLFARPGLEEFFKMCKQRGVEVVVWTAGLKSYAQAIVDNIDREHAVTHCIYRHSKWFTGQAGYRKDLAALGRPLDRVLIVENTPDCIRGYQDNGILVEDYEGGEQHDDTIRVLTSIIEGLCESEMTVPQYISSCPLLRRITMQTDVGDFIHVYALNASVWAPGMHIRVNRDLQTLELK